MNTRAHPIPGNYIEIAMDRWTEPFWTAARERRLTAAQCGQCGQFRMPPTPFCPRCRSQSVQWPTLPGTGTVFSFTICRQSPYAEVPDFLFIPAVIELHGAPGARLVSNLVDVEVDTVRIGMRVMVDWNVIQGDWLVPIFRPHQQSSISSVI